MALTKEDLQAIQALLEAERDNTRRMIQEETNPLAEGLQQVRASQLKVELEQYPRIAAALDGVLAGIEKNQSQDERIAYLERKTDNHDARIYNMETQIKKAL